MPATKKATISVYFTNMAATRVIIHHLSRKKQIPPGWSKGSTQHSDPNDASKGAWLVHLDPHKLEHLIVPKLKDPSQKPGKDNPWQITFSLAEASNADKTFFRAIGLDSSGMPVASVTVPANFKGTFG